MKQDSHHARNAEFLGKARDLVSVESDAASAFASRKPVTTCGRAAPYATPSWVKAGMSCTAAGPSRPVVAPMDVRTEASDQRSFP